MFWAIIEGAIAIARLLGGGLKALQSAAVSTGLPFTLVLMVACYALGKALMSEPRLAKDGLEHNPARVT